jgi:hypothetical protein
VVGQHFPVGSSGTAATLGGDFEIFSCKTKQNLNNNIKAHVYAQNFEILDSNELI